jgi:DNA-binding transcriptional ArsR family regulator
LRAPAHRHVDAVFDALSDPTRRRLVETLARGGTVTASGLAAQLPITRQAVAKHLTALRGAELVSASRVGRETQYKLRPQPLDEAAHWIQMVSAEWDDRLEALRRSLEKRRSTVAVGWGHGAGHGR